MHQRCIGSYNTFSENQMKIITGAYMKICKKCGQWTDDRRGCLTFQRCLGCDAIKKEKKKKIQLKIQLMSVAKSSVCIETDICSICMDDMIKGQQIYKLCCNHCFHPTCVEQLILEHKKQQCPNCRTDINSIKFKKIKKK
jgi:hypothetical protein